MNAMTTVPPRGPTGLVPSGFDQAIQLANMMATGKLVPAALQKSPGDCLMVIEQAMRWGMSPFAVAQEVSVIQGKMMFSGKIVAAALHSAPGLLVGRLDYKFSGTGADLEVEVIGHLRGEDQARTVSVRLADAKTTNQHWQKSPEQMLTYHAARVWARRHAPEVMLGVYSPEEMQTVESEQAPIRVLARVPDAVDHDELPALAAPTEDRAAAWLETQTAAIAACTTPDDLHAIAGDERVFKALTKLRTTRPDLATRYEDAMRAAHAAFRDAEVEA